MKRTNSKKYFKFKDSQTASEFTHTLAKEGYLGTAKICLPAIHEEKFGTSVIVKPSQTYSAILSPPPIRPMVEKYPYYRSKQSVIKAQKRIEEGA